MSINVLEIRRALGRKDWLPPVRFGDDGWRLDHRDGDTRAIVSCGRHDGPVEWIHASISHPGHLPTYLELCNLHDSILGGEWWAYQVFAPPGDHINIHPYALHLWGLADGTRALPDFGKHGVI